MSEKVLIDRELLVKATMLPSMKSMKANRRDIEERRRAQAEIRKMLAAAPVAQEEPVAWMWECCGIHLTANKELARSFVQDGFALTPLYAAPPAHLDVPRCQCCGYLVTESEHRGCLRSASPHPDASVLVEALELARRTLAMAGLEGEVTRRIDTALAGKGGE